MMLKKHKIHINSEKMLQYLFNLAWLSAGHQQSGWHPQQGVLVKIAISNGCILSVSQTGLPVGNTNAKNLYFCLDWGLFLQLPSSRFSQSVIGSTPFKGTLEQYATTYILCIQTPTQRSCEMPVLALQKELAFPTRSGGSGLQLWGDVDLAGLWTMLESQGLTESYQTVAAILAASDLPDSL